MNLSRRRLLPCLGLALAASGLRPARAQSAPSGLVMATGRPGSDYALFGPAWGQLAAAPAGVDIAYHETGGADANILLIDEGTAQLGLTTAVVAHQAVTGTSGWTAGAKISSFRLLFPAYVSVLQIFAPPGGPTRLSELAGLTIGVGPDGGSVDATVAQILGLLGVMPARTVTGDLAPQIKAMQSGQLDACAFIGAPPLSVITQAAMGHRFSLIGFSQDECALVAAKLPGFREIILPSGTFPGLGVPVSTLGTDNYAICAASLAPALANIITSAALSHRAQLARAIPAAANPPPPTGAGGLGLKFHQGAAAALNAAGQRVSGADIG
ncbi:TAXI family TRAP transporter solute-binding subunit [Acidocella sp.]|uniref:TAXI family TRAP transporter solute-binding subunit n=1 Tax=Acidocella sp. TaxID=50710 RepID=UPI002606AFC9|nr:TAXI family TRAP transporter solute-binding subunit [Acidocella sp.]